MTHDIQPTIPDGAFSEVETYGAQQQGLAEQFLGDTPQYAAEGISFDQQATDDLAEASGGYPGRNMLTTARSAISGAIESAKESPLIRKLTAGTAAASLALPGIAGAKKVEYHPRSNAYIKKNCHYLAVANPGSGFKDVRQDGIHVWTKLDDSEAKSGGTPHYYWRIPKKLKLCAVVGDRPDGKTIKPDPDNLTSTSGDVKALPGDSLKTIKTFYVYAERKR